MVAGIGRGAVYAALCGLLAGCTQQIDFEHDVPQRAKSISVVEANKVRASMEVPELRQQYQNYMRRNQQSTGKSLVDLEKEKREIERKIAVIVQTNSGRICPLCRKKYGIKPSKKTHVVAKKTKAKSPKIHKKHQKQQRPLQPRPPMAPGMNPGFGQQQGVPPQGMGLPPAPGMPFGAPQMQPQPMGAPNMPAMPPVMQAGPGVPPQAFGQQPPMGAPGQLPPPALPAY